MAQVTIFAYSDNKFHTTLTTRAQKSISAPTCVPETQGEFEGVFPKDLQRRTATRTKFGAHFWRRLIANIDLAQQFGAE
jgi:hypothetical protein